MTQYYPKIKPSMFKLSGDWWIRWPYGELSVASLMRHPLGSPKYIQGMAVRELRGGSEKDSTKWHWSCNDGFTEGVYSHGPSSE